MKKTTLSVWVLISSLGVLAQDMGITNPPPTTPPGEMETMVVTNAAPTNEPPSPPLATVESAPAPVVASAPVTTTINSAPSGQTYSTLTYGTSPSTVSAADPAKGHIGVGIILGEPVGADVKYWLNDTMAIDGAMGWSDHRHSDLYIHGDVLWHKFDLIDISPAPGKLPVYFGVGGLLRFRNHGESNNVGIRVPVGVSYIFDNAPIDIFAEIAPALDVAPDLHGEITGGIGIRFWF